MRERILIVDDEALIRQTLSEVLADEEYAVLAVSSGEEAIKTLAHKKIDIVLLDIWMRGKDGIETLEAIRKADPNQTVIMMSGHGNIETAVKATKLGAYDFIEKPLSLEKVLLALERGLEASRLEAQNRLLRAKLHGEVEMVGRSKAIQKIRAQIETVAPTNGWVLVTGENGTGKEIVARLIHRSSPLAKAPFVDVNCAAIPEELIESELFGHERGAFTGAAARKIGKFESANGGTLFLDEIGDMSLKTQAKVLRVLQEGNVQRVGGSESIETATRLIAATNKDLAEAIQSGDFREDLYYRINVIPISIPPLRERIEDLVPLIERFLAEFAADANEEPRRLSRDAMDTLSEYAWPGNVRELKNLIERLVIMTGREKKLIRRDDIPDDWMAHHKKDLQLDLSKQETLAVARKKFEQAFISEKLAESGGNISRTAERLGISRENLSKKIKALGIEVKKEAE